MYEGRTQERQSAVNDMSGMRGGIALIRRLVRAVAFGIRSVLYRVKNRGRGLSVEINIFPLLRDIWITNATKHSTHSLFRSFVPPPFRYPSMCLLS